MFETIEAVPLPLRSFYQVETRSEQQFNEDETPVMQDKEYTYQDENGDTQTATRPERVYVDNDYVVQVPMGERKDISFVWQAAELHRGKRDALIRRFLGMVCNDNQWTFCAKYLEWHVELLRLQTLEPIRAQDEQGQFVADDVDTPENEAWELSQSQIDEQLSNHAALEPTKPLLIDCDQWFLGNAVRLRSYAFLPKEKQLEMLFDDKVNDTTTFEDHNLAVKAQYPKLESIPA